MKIALSFLAALFSVSASAQLAFLKPKAAFRLVAENSAPKPGDTVAVMLEVALEPGWHTYWENPVLETALSPSLKWKLPEGYEAGPMSFPFPKNYRADGKLLLVNEGTPRFLTGITIPVDAKPGPVTLKASSDFIVCDEANCVPAFKDLELVLDIGGSGNGEDVAGLFREARQAIPTVMEGVSATAQKKDGTLEVAIKGLPEGLKADGLHFFPLNPGLDAEAPQTFGVKDGVVTLKARGSGEKLSGVLVAPEPEFNGSRAVRVQEAGGDTVQAAKEVSWGLLLQAFLGGMILNIMPCVFPVIGLKIMGFVKQSGENSRKIMAHGLAYTAGVVVFFLILGAVVLSIRKGGEHTSLGEFFSNPQFNWIMACVLLALGMSFLGVFELGAGLTSTGGRLTTLTGYAGSFFSGFLTVVLATPCAGFLLGYVLAVAFSVPYAHAMLIFLCIALGIAAPYLVLAASPGLVKMLPKPGRWMEISKQFFGILMLGAVLWLGWVISSQIDQWEMLLVWMSFVLVGVAVWIYGLSTEPGRKAGKGTGLILAAVFLVVGCRLGYPSKEPGLTWTVWTPELEKSLIAEGKPVYVDFTASWCLQCQTNKRVYKSPELKELFERKGVQTLKADWSNPNPEIGKALEKLDRGAIPVNAVYYPAQVAPLILSPLLTEGEVRAALEKLPDV